MKWLKNYKYKSLTLVSVSILIAVTLSKYDLFNQIIFQARYIPFLGSLIAGILYASASTAAFGVLIITDLSKRLSPIEISLLAGIGCAVADFTIFRFFKNNLFKEIMPIYNRFGGQHLTRFMQHRLLRWSLPIIGAIIIASPFPDEIGIGLMGLTRIKSYQFVLLCLALDIIGVFLLVSTINLVK